MLKFLRRDPAAYITLIQSILFLAVAWGLFGLTDAHLPLFMAVVNGLFGVVAAILTKRAAFSIAIGLVQAVIALFAQYGLTLTDDQTHGVIFLSTVVLGFFNWTQNSPADNPGLREEPMTVEGTVVTNNLAISSADADVIADHVDRRLAQNHQRGM